MTRTERLTDIIGSVLSIEDDAIITPTADFGRDLGADSLDHVEIIMAIEQEYDVMIDDEAAAELTTVEKVVAYLDKHKK